MTEHEIIQAEWDAWIKKHFRPKLITTEEAFAEGWIAAKNDTKRLQAEGMPVATAKIASELPTFDEWFQVQEGVPFDRSVYTRLGMPYDSYLRGLSINLRAYVSEMVKRR